MIKYDIKMKEVRDGRISILTSSYTTEDDNMTEQDIIDFYGLNEPDIIDYTINKEII